MAFLDHLEKTEMFFWCFSELRVAVVSAWLQNTTVAQDTFQKEQHK